MIKGRTVIELTNVNSGEKEVYKDSNMVTNAISLFYKSGGMTNPSAFNDLLKTDAVENLLGGILCLDGTITEDANIVHVPTGINMVANGSVGILNSGNPPELGSYNESESGWQQDGSYKLTFDYTTSQGNGVIKSVCMTSKYEGLKGIGNASNTSRSASAPQTQANYNAINYFEIMRRSNSTFCGIYNNRVHVITGFANGKATIKEYSLPVTSLDLRDTIDGREITTREVNLPSELQNVSLCLYWYDTDGHNAYGVTNVVCDGQYAYMLFTFLGYTASGWSGRRSFHLSASHPVYLVKYDTVNHVFSLEETLTPSVVGFSNDDDYHGVQTIGMTKNYILWEEHVISISNTSDVNDITDFAYKMGYLASISVIDDDHIQIEKTIIDLSTASTKLSNNAVTYSKMGEVNGCLNYGVSYASSTIAGDDRRVFIWRNPSYIATINNLENAVEKTGDKTMKVTYILTFTD